MNGAESAKNSHSDVRDTTFTPAIFRSAQRRLRPAPPTIRGSLPANHGKMRAQVQHKDRGIDRHVEDPTRQAKATPPEIPRTCPWRGAPRHNIRLPAAPRGQLADHERRGQAPEQRGNEQDEDAPPVPGAMDDLFGAIGSARHHKEGGGDQGPKREADEFFPVGDYGRLGVFELWTLAGL